MRHFFIRVLDISASIIAICIVLVFAIVASARSNSPFFAFIGGGIVGVLFAALFLGILFLVLQMNESWERIARSVERIEQKMAG
jgi:hypothetical protein